MTKLQSADGVSTNGLIEGNNNEEEDCCCEDEIDDHEENEPLGYQHFLYDVNIEYSPGGTRSNSIDNKHCFKMKYLPYMVSRNRHTPEANNKLQGSDEFEDDHNNDNVTNNNSDIVDGVLECSNDSPNNTVDSRHVNVTRTTCAFLGKSEYVPISKFKHRRVILELISAKLSQQTSHGLASNTSFTNLIDVAENPTHNGHLSNRDNTNLAALSSSKKFVNYTLLIKTAPGLDNHPAVIERRFSDFLTLYQGLKSDVQYANIVDRYVTFPKKVYMGNFSLAKIAERSIEFTRLLSICMSRNNLLWSLPFVSFLIDKELKEAHRLSLFGDPDDVQALVETVYYIEKKLYLPSLRAISSRDTTTNSSSNSLMSTSYNNGRYSPTTTTTNTTSTLPNGMIQSLSNETISADSNNSNQTSCHIGEADPSPDQSMNCEQTSQQDEKTSSSLINQRILATFCMLFIVYFRNNGNREMKLAVREFNQLISSQEYIDSLINTRHYMSLRACLLFLMNLNQDDVISETTRQWLKRKLEDIDGAHADLEDRSIDMRTRGETTTTNMNRVTQRDLTSLLKDRNFCDFQPGKA